MNIPQGKRSRGNKTSAATREAQNRIIIEGLEGGKTKKEIRAEIGISEPTLWRRLQDLELKFGQANAERFTQFKIYVAEAIAEEADELLRGNRDPKVAVAWNGLIRTLNDMFGHNAPRRSESVNFNADADPQRLGPYRWFCYVTRGLSLEEIRHPITELCDRIRAEKKPEPMPQPPNDSPLWHPLRKELAE